MGSFTDIFIKRPVFATCLSLILVIIGIIAFKSLTIRQFPKIDNNTISVTTTFPGASASVVESFITSQIESSVSGVDGVDYITSNSDEGKSVVKIHLKINADVNAAMNDVNSDLSSVIHNLPKGINNPIVNKIDSDSIPEIVINVSDPNLSPEAVTDYVNRSIQPQLATLSGVGSATVVGQKYSMRIWLNSKLMSEYGITPSEVQTALMNNNVTAQAGEIDQKYNILNINASTDINTPQEFDNLPIKSAGGKVVHLKDIGYAKLGPEDTTENLIIDGQQSVGILISPKSDANPLDVAKVVKKQIAFIQKSLPKEMTISIPRDASKFISASIKEVNKTLLISISLVVIIIFLFLGSARAVLIPVVTIPLSIITTFAVMLALGFTINTLTLLAFVLAIGLVVDDAIVVLENIHRHIESGLTPFEAALKGAKEIAGAVIAMTITLAAVYAPIGFTGGLTGALFREFAFTLAASILISGFIALTLSPMMCSKVMNADINKAGSFAHYIDVIFEKLSHKYQNLLQTLLRNKSLVLSLTVAILASGALIYMFLPHELAPLEDQGAIIVSAEGPTSANVDYTTLYTNQLSQIASLDPDVENEIMINGFGTSGQSSAIGFLSLKDWDKRSHDVNQIMQTLNPQVNEVAGIKSMLINPPSLPGNPGFFPFQFVVKTTGSYATLNRVVNQMIAQMHQNKNFLMITTDLHLDKPDLNVTIDRQKASQLGISMSQINTTLMMDLGQPQVTYFQKDGQAYEVIPQLQSMYRDNPNLLNTLNVTTASGKSIPLSSLVTISSSVVPSQLNHFQQQRAAMINAIIMPNYSTGQALQYVEGLAKKDFTPTMSYDFFGTTRQFVDASSATGMIIGFALIFIYLVLSAQFESFRDPLIMLFNVPLAAMGALATLYYSGNTLNIYSEIALVTLMGLISKHGILIVEFANQLQDQGRSKLEAVIESAKIRLRPILMTTAAMVLGVLPMVFASGPGSASRQSMGLVITGGMLIGTLFTLMIIPVVYAILAKKRSQAC